MMAYGVQIIGAERIALHKTYYGALAETREKMLLLVYLILFFPVYFGARHFIELSPYLTNVLGGHTLIALFATFVIVAGIFWLKEKI